MNKIILAICVMSLGLLPDFASAENRLSPKRLKKAQVGETYRQRITLIGNAESKRIKRCAAEGYLPDGLSFAKGVISGTPTRVEECNVCLKAGSRRHGSYVRKTHRLTVEGNEPYAISTQVLRQATSTVDGEIGLTVNHSGQGIPIDQISVSLRPFGCSETDGGSSLLSYQPSNPIAAGESYTDTFEFPDLSSGACIEISVAGYDGNENRRDCETERSLRIVQADLN